MNALSFTRNAVRTVTVVVMLVIVMIATADGFAQSYSGLYDWALQHKLSGWKAESFPLLVDLFILVGELGLFLLALDGFRLQRSFLAWSDVLLPFSVAAVGWLVSLWFNVNHIPNATGEDKVTAGVPPVTAMIGLLILLRTVHRYMAKLDEQKNETPKITVEADTELVPEPEPEPVREPVMWSIPVRPARRWWYLFGTRKRHMVYMPMVPPVRPEPEPEPMPESLSVPESARIVPPWHPSGTISDVPERPEDARPEPVSPNGQSEYGRWMRHDKWDKGLKIYQESVQGPGKALSQRELAAELEMRNRTLAAAIIKYVKEENSNGGQFNGVPTSTESATSPEGSA